MIIAIIGESAGGKSSIADYISKCYDFKKVVTCTTRPKREYETDGVDYYFISDEAFLDLENSDYFAETASYNGWKYGSAKTEYVGNKVVVLTPRGLRSIRRNGIKDIFSVYLDVPRRDRMKKSLDRGDDIEEIYRRSLSDVGQFDGVEDEVDLVISNPGYAKRIDEVAKSIMGFATI
mgnify:CR=1 FL=1